MNSKSNTTKLLHVVVFLLSIFGIVIGRFGLGDNLFADILKTLPGANRQLLSRLDSSDTTDSQKIINKAHAQENHQSKVEDNDLSENAPFQYEVNSGDTLNVIAEKYGLKLQTILWANNLNAKDLIKPGQVLTLIPVDGILHEVKKGETIAQIAALHNVSFKSILEYNSISDPMRIYSGDMVIVPGGILLPSKREYAITAKQKTGTLEKIEIIEPSSKLHWPTTTTYVTQGYSAAHRGLDIANGGKPPIHSAQSGVVEVATFQKGWGNTIVIRGGDGLVTRYSHADKISVIVGQTVGAGEEIGIVGNTGTVRGPTGLHLDFRVYKNGIAVNPLPLLGKK